MADFKRGGSGKCKKATRMPDDHCNKTSVSTYYEENKQVALTSWFKWRKYFDMRIEIYHELLEKLFWLVRDILTRHWMHIYT